jgi:hypothetical protein
VIDNAYDFLQNESMKNTVVCGLMLAVLSFMPTKSMAVSERENTAKKNTVKDLRAVLTIEQANRLAELPLKCSQKEFPNKPGEVLTQAVDIGSPKNLHPAFYGCFDWHSAVHGHWMLIKLLKLFPKLEKVQPIRAMLAENISAEKILSEVNYFNRAGEKSFERTYGWAWLLKLAEELHNFDDPLARQLENNLQPLTDLIVERYLEFLPKLTYPIRVGEHSNTAFGLVFAWDYAHTVDHQALKQLIADRAKDFFLSDKKCPLAWEPSGFDFLSPCLEEADIMRRILPTREYAVWLKQFLPQLADKKFNLAPAIVSDRNDGKLVHLDGLNFSRAWCLYGIAAHLKEYRHLKKIADQHLQHSLPAITSGSYEGEHWLATFAVYALSGIQ